MADGDTADGAWLALRSSIVDSIRSGLFSGREVMEALGVSSGTLGGWCRAEDQRREPVDRRKRGSTSPFAAVSLTGPSRTDAFVVLLRGGRRVRVAPGFDEAELCRLVRTLESC